MSGNREQLRKVDVRKRYLRCPFCGMTFAADGLNYGRVGGRQILKIEHIHLNDAPWSECRKTFFVYTDEFLQVNLAERYLCVKNT